MGVHGRHGRTRTSSPRRGVALLTVLWVVTVSSIITAGMLLQSRDAVGTAQNRRALARAAWRASGCAAELMARIDDTLRLSPQRNETWQALDASISMREMATDCRV